MHPLSQDLQFTLRLIRRRSGMAILVLAALGLGIGLNTAIFSAFNAIVLRPLPIHDPDRVVWLHSRVNQTGGQLGTSYADFLDWRAQSHLFDSMAAMYFFSATLSGQGPPEHIKVVGISASGFNSWGVRTVLGRNFTEDDDQPGANRVIVLTHGFWQQKFGGNQAILGKNLVLDDQQYTIIGVLQPTPINVLTYSDVYVANGPLLNLPHIMERDTRWFFPVGRMKPHVTIAQAQAEMDTIAARLAAQYPATTKDMGIRVESMTENLISGSGKPLLLLILASGLIFLLAVLNVMTVFLVGTLERAQELSIRLALGSPRSILLRQLLLQALIFAIGGTAFGLIFAKLGLFYFLDRFPNAAERFHETNIDFSVIAVTLGMTLCTTILSALIPALYAFRLNIGNALRGELGIFASNKRRPFARGILIFSEVAFASALSLVAGLLIKSLYEVQKVDLGFNPHQLISFQITPPLNRYKEPEKQLSLYKAALEKLTSLPAMKSVSGISSLPLTSQALINSMDVDSQSPLFGKPLLVEHEAILPGFFQVMRLPILEGRDFTSADHQGALPVVIVDDVLAEKLWPGKSPLGKRLHLSLITGEPAPWREVIGVVKEIKHFGPERQVRWMQVYVPQYQDPSPSLSFLINTTLSNDAAKNAALKSLQELDKDLPVESFETLDNYLNRNYLSGRKVSLLLLTTFAGVGVLLALFGIYGVVANAVTQRRREIAIRMALGATPVRTIFLVTRLTLFATFGGILIGSISVMSLTRALSSMLYGVTALDPAVYVVSTTLVILLAITASVIPVIRLFRFNIQQVLRQ
jgi:putative ABC transport system permease protein